ncbi:MAG TPA: hypothetical protein VLB50_04505 [Ignavibacteriaceae bacterium]|nr:hypothetical protein [Ignavibacteriaceae bacterium]
MTKPEPWYIHAILYVVIAILIVVLIKVAIIDPKDAVEMEKYYKTESHLRMKNIKEAEILWNKKYGHFTANLDSLINFIKTDPMVDSVKNAYDSLSRRPANPFVSLTSGQFSPDSLYRTPKTHNKYVLQIDTSVTADTIFGKNKEIKRIISTKVVGTRYYLEDPDGYGSIGSLESDALKNTASWE